MEAACCSETAETFSASELTAFTYLTRFENCGLLSVYVGTTKEDIVPYWGRYLFYVTAPSQMLTAA